MSAHAIRWLGATLIALVLTSSYLLDGPSEHAAAVAVAADVQDAIQTSITTDRQARAVALLCGQTVAISGRPDGAIQCKTGNGFKTLLTETNL